MRLKKGDKATVINLPAIDGTVFDTNRLKGKPYMLSFFRFAGCPFCNMRMHKLTKVYKEFGDDFEIVALFDSPIANLVRHIKGHKAPFPVLADERNQYYNEYRIEHSMMGVLKGMLLRMPTLIKGMLKGYVPMIIKGSITTMPAEFLIDKDGIIQKVHYGTDEGDHMPIEEIKAFALKGETNHESMAVACACSY